jgi:tetratricopeptide (TPR) repeat protein
VWTDEKILAGETWTRVIDNAIDESVAVIVLMSKEAHQSEYVTYEWSYALGAGKQVITMLVDDDINLHPRLEEFQYSDFTGNKRPWKAIHEGLDRINRQLREVKEEQAFRWMKDGDAELEQEDIRSALASYDLALEVANDELKVKISYRKARLNLRRLRLISDDDKKKEVIDETIKLLEGALKIHAEYSAARAYLGYVYRLKADVVSGSEKYDVLDNARLALKQALEEQPDLIDSDGESFWNSYGGVLRRQGDIRKKADDSEGAQKKYAEAIDAYERATGFVKKSSYPYGNLAVLYLLMEDKDKMRQNYRRVGFYSSNDASDFWGHGDQLVAQLLNETVNMDEVERIFRKYDAFAPSYARDSLKGTLKSVAASFDGPDDDATRGLIDQYIDRL